MIHELVYAAIYPVNFYCNRAWDLQPHAFYFSLLFLVWILLRGVRRESLRGLLEVSKVGSGFDVLDGRGKLMNEFCELFDGALEVDWRDGVGRIECSK